MLKCIVIDDHRMSLEVLNNHCRKMPDLELLGSFTDPLEAVTFLHRQLVDLVFLDVEMTGMNGFELLDSLSYKPMVVLVSAKSDYACLGFEYQVLDYLQKPVHFNRFRDAVRRVQQFDGINRLDQDPEEVFVRSGTTLKRIPFSDIFFAESHEDGVLLHCREEDIRISTPLREVESRLGSRYFIKVHRSFVVNLSHIENMSTRTLYVSGREIPVSKSQRLGLLKRMNIV